MTGAVVGRAAELTAIDAFLDGGARPGVAALVLDGEAGIGKTTVLPIPASPSRTSATVPEPPPSSNASIAVSSAARPTTSPNMT